MNQSFWWSYRVETFLFSGVSIKTVPSFVGVCCLIASCAFLLEGIRYLQAQLSQRELVLRSKQLRTVCPTITESSSLLESSPTSSQQANDEAASVMITRCDRCRLGTAEFGSWLTVQSIGWFVMLIIMLFNGWFLISSIIGSGIGYFVFGPLFMKIILRNCDIIKDTYCKMENCGATAEVDTSQMEGSSIAAKNKKTSRSSVNNCHSRLASSDCNSISVQVECHPH